MKRFIGILKRIFAERNYLRYFTFLMMCNSLMSFGIVEIFRLVIEAVTKTPTTMPEMMVGYYLIAGWFKVKIFDAMEFIMETAEDPQYLIDEK